MENFSTIKESLEIRRKLPLVAIVCFCALLAYLLILFWGINRRPVDFLPLAGLWGGAILLTILDIKLGLGLLIFCIGISPEFELWGVPNIRLEDFLFPIVFMSWIVRSAVAKERLAPTPLKVPMLLLILISLISSLFNAIYSEINLLQCLFRNGKFLEYFLIFLLTLNALREASEIRNFIYLLQVVAMLVGIYGIFQILTPQYHEKVTGPVGETSNILGAYYVFHISMILGLLSRQGTRRWLLLAALILLTIPVLHTMARATYFALFSSLLVLFLIRRSAVTGIAILACSIGILASSVAMERLLSILGILQGDAPSSLTARMEIWKVLIHYIPESPIIGHGIGNLSPGAVDNEYIQKLYELGLLGFLVFIWMFWRILSASFRLGREIEDPTFQGFAIGCFAGTVGLLAHSLAATTFTAIRTAEAFFFTLGILYAIAGKVRLSGGEEALPEELPALSRGEYRPEFSRSLEFPGAVR